jgi:biopolymer transport protein ExbB
MKKLFTLIALTGMLTMGSVTASYAQDPEAEQPTEATAEEGAPEETATEAPAETPAAEPAPEGAADAPDETATVSTEQEFKRYFIEGGPEFMAIVLVALIIGLALAIERIVYLNMASTNTQKLLNEVENALNAGGVEKAKEVCRNTRGPIASIFYQGLDRSKDSIENAEKSVMAYGSVQMGLLEKGLSWISLFIALAPMLGFLGTVIGMIQAFDTIEKAEGIEIGQVAKGIKVALLTTVFGLIVAMILQVFYNYIVAKIDSLVNQMEDASISLIDLIIRHQENNKA